MVADDYVLMAVDQDRLRLRMVNHYMKTTISVKTGAKKILRQISDQRCECMQQLGDELYLACFGMQIRHDST